MGLELEIRNYPIPVYRSVSLEFVGRTHESADRVAASTPVTVLHLFGGVMTPPYEKYGALSAHFFQFGKDFRKVFR